MPLNSKVGDTYHKTLAKERDRMQGVHRYVHDLFVDYFNNDLPLLGLKAHMDKASSMIAYVLDNEDFPDGLLPEKKRGRKD